MSRPLRWWLVVCLLAWSSPRRLFVGQGTSTSSLSGVAVDADGGTLPGASVVIKNNATGRHAESDHQRVRGVLGAGARPRASTPSPSRSPDSRPPSSARCKLLAGTPANLPKITLEIGSLSETRRCQGRHRARSRRRARRCRRRSTRPSDQQLPMVTQNGSAFIANLPGVDTGGNHSVRNSTVNGLPAERDQHHARRHQRHGHGRQGTVVDDPSQAGPGRGSHGHRRGAGRRQLRPGRGQRQVGDALRHATTSTAAPTTTSGTGT